MKQLERGFKRIVIKVGTSIVAKDGLMGFDWDCARKLVRQVSCLMRQNKEVILVSSGAIAMGMLTLKISQRPKRLSFLQAAASTGQVQLMQAYETLFKKEGFSVAQVLLTWEDFEVRRRYLNAKNTLLSLLKFGIIPVVNENDTVSVDEIKFGDNDRLSALVANLIEADLLIILSDVDGLYGKTEELIPIVEKIDSQLEKLAKGTSRTTSIGGMITKIEAAKIVTDSGIPCILANGREDCVLEKAIAGQSIGTLFIPKGTLRAKKRWIAYSRKPKGKLYVDDGAKSALIKSGKSLLSPGIVQLQGNFQAKDMVSIVDERGYEFARGLSNLSLDELKLVKGKKIKNEVVHRDNLVILQEEICP